jgi:hypothetical protein
MYNGNPGIRKAGEQIEYTDELIQEYIKCKEDIIHFAEKYFYIISIDKGKHLIELYDYQKKILKACTDTPEDKQHLICKIFRQAGKCVHKNSKIKIRNKKTNEIKEISIEDFYTKIKNEKM